MIDDDHFKELINSDELYIKRIKEISEESDKEENSTLDLLIHPTDIPDLTFGEKLSDLIATFGSSWKFIISFFGFLGIWITLNRLPHIQHWDEYPFILLNLILSCLAAFQAPLIMMSQRRQEERDRKRAEFDLLVNLRSELQIKEINKKFDLLIINQIKDLVSIQQKLYKKVEYIESKINTNSE